MKAMIKALLKGVWRSTQPVRDPILRKYEAFLRRCLPPSAPPERYPMEEWNALLDQVVRELVRLQRQTESLQEAIDALSPAPDQPAVAGLVSRKGQLQAG